MAAAWNNCGTEFCPIDQRDLELRSIEDELSVLESQIQGLLEKHSQLCEQKTMLETSQVKDTLREHRFEAPSTSTPGTFNHERNKARIKMVEACFTPAPSYNGPWLYQQRKSHFRARTLASLTQKFDLSISNRFEPLSSPSTPKSSPPSLHSSPGKTFIIGDSV